MKLKILALGKEETTQYIENSLLFRNMAVVKFQVLPDTLSLLKQENFNLAIVDCKIEDLKNVCFKIIWLCRVKVAVLGGSALEDKDDLRSLGVAAFLSDNPGQAELAADVSAFRPGTTRSFKTLR
jgi:hypothetical protein